MTTTTNAAKTASAATTLKEAEPRKIVRRIGSTDYIVSVKFNPDATETLEQKLLRMIESEVHKSA
jgi:hypothetical protein